MPSAAKNWSASPQEIAQARLRLLSAGSASREETVDFIPRISPTLFRPYYLEPVTRLFDRIEAGEEVRAIVNIPRQHGKTTTILHGLAKVGKAHPDWPIAYASYNATQARKKGKILKGIAERAGIRFQGATLEELSIDGIEGGFMIRGVGEGLTGNGVKVLVVDDPHKDLQDAASPACRRNVIDWFEGSALSGLRPGGSVILNMSRFHLDDLAGYCLAQNKTDDLRQWEEINLPAISSDGKALCPELRPLAYLEKMRDTIGPYKWRALYQGNPIPRGGQVFSDAYFYDELPKDGYQEGFGIDLAYTSKTSADHSVCMRGRGKGNVLYITGVNRAQVRADQFGAVLHAEQALSPHALMRWYTGGQERGIIDLQRALFEGLNIVPTPAAQDKFFRAQPAAAGWNRGAILLPRNRGALSGNKVDDGQVSWVDTLLSEVLAFTGQGDAQDDQVDALAALWDLLCGGCGVGII